MSKGQATGAPRRVPKTAWKKGQSGNPKGKPKGTPNKLTAEIRAMIQSAAHAAGLKVQQKHSELAELDPTAAYLAQQAEENPQAFLGLLARTVPQKIDHEVTMMTEKMADLLVQRRQQLAELRREERAIEEQRRLRSTPVEDAEVIEDDDQ